jgi:hypothetical protein
MDSCTQDMGLNIANIIVEGERAAVDGEISMTDKDGRRKGYAFCDIYRLEAGQGGRTDRLCPRGQQRDKS